MRVIVDKIDPEAQVPAIKIAKKAHPAALHKKLPQTNIPAQLLPSRQIILHDLHLLRPLVVQKLESIPEKYFPALIIELV